MRPEAASFVVPFEPRLAQLPFGDAAPPHLMFVDEVRIHVSSGAGGDGAVSFRREKHVPRGGPDGGAGGDGGSVVVVADPMLTTLVDFRFKRRFKAGRGVNGGGGNKSGKKGEDIELRVP